MSLAKVSRHLLSPRIRAGFFDISATKIRHRSPIMQPSDSMLNSFSFQPLSGYDLETPTGLQPAAPIYQADQHRFADQGLLYGIAHTGRFGNQQQGALNMHNPFVNVYHHPFQSVSLSAIQPFESCLPQSSGMYSGPTDHSQYMASPQTMALPPDAYRQGSPSSPAQASTQAGVPAQWSGSMLSVSLEQPFDVHTFFANSDGTISNLLATPYTPSNMPSGERVIKKRKSGDEPSSSYAAPTQREKRQCFGVRVRPGGVPLRFRLVLIDLFLSVDQHRPRTIVDARLVPDVESRCGWRSELAAR
jgi:hypothetical protein